MDYPLRSEVSSILGTYNMVNLNSGGEFTGTNCWTILVQTVVDYLGGWILQLLAFSHIRIFSSKSSSKFWG